MIKGSKHSDETKKKMSEQRRGIARTTGYRFTDAQRANIAAGLSEHYAKLRVAGKLLLAEERTARDKARSAAKRLVRRVLTMARKRKDATTEALLGYTKAELRAHLEKQFRPGMSWDKRESFHIDHIVPAKWFFERGIFDVAKINALSNLQVLTPTENRAKSGSYPAHFNGGPATYTEGIA